MLRRTMRVLAWLAACALACAAARGARGAHPGRLCAPGAAGACRELALDLGVHPGDARLRALDAHGLVVEKTHARQYAASGTTPAYASDALLPVLDAARIAYTLRNESHRGRGGPARAEGYHDDAALERALRAAAAAAPALVRVREIGRSAEGRALLVAEVGRGTGVGVRYIANMHGDEVVGREMLLRLVAHLVERDAAGDARVRALLDAATLHVLASMNPDGFAARRRTNARGVDLNRDFPDQYRSPDAFARDDESNREPEVRAVMEWIEATAARVVLAANMHGGALVANYPWDGSASGRAVYAAAPDDALFRRLATTYARAHGRMAASREFAGGITNGAGWYALYGGMQDWAYARRDEAHLTLELSDEKWPPASELDAYWRENREPLLAYAELALTLGVRGCVQGPRGAARGIEVRVDGIEHVSRTRDDDGCYVRLLAPRDAPYTLRFRDAGGADVAVREVRVREGAQTTLDVWLAR